MTIIFKASLFLSLAILTILGCFLIFLGFNILNMSIISPFINYKIAIPGFFILALVIFLFFLEEQVFYSSDYLEINGEYGSIRITKFAIKELIMGIEIEGIEKIDCKVSIRKKAVDLKIIVSCFYPYISEISQKLNEEIDEVMKGLLITNYKKMLYINNIKKKRKLI